uniref:Uncharacterized protein n=1 Tax=Mucochytrium quahogii TaxID=96639 RepID=A0A7S2WJ58_9STRA|mmetsp:Transcript_2370/g.3434  ORF Transcript_2370/g.3434 Transcript_2370/m.3434 type:complete len:286 (-) Transcript_2370:701-1558(-)
MLLPSCETLFGNSEYTANPRDVCTHLDIVIAFVLCIISTIMASVLMFGFFKLWRKHQSSHWWALSSIGLGAAASFTLFLSSLALVVAYAGESYIRQNLALTILLQICISTTHSYVSMRACSYFGALMHNSEMMRLQKKPTLKLGLFCYISALVSVLGILGGASCIAALGVQSWVDPYLLQTHISVAFCILNCSLVIGGYLYVTLVLKLEPYRQKEILAETVWMNVFLFGFWCILNPVFAATHLPTFSLSIFSYIVTWLPVLYKTLKNCCCVASTETARVEEELEV